MKTIYATLILSGAVGVFWLIGFVIEICMGSYGYGVGSWDDEPLERIRLGFATTLALTLTGSIIYIISEQL